MGIGIYVLKAKVVCTVYAQKAKLVGMMAKQIKKHRVCSGGPALASCQAKPKLYTEVSCK